MSQLKPDAGAAGPPVDERLQRRLRALEGVRRALLEAVPAAAAEVDAAGRVVACNRRFAILSGATEGELAGKPLASLSLNAAVRLERRPLPPPAEGELVVEAGPPGQASEWACENEERCRSLIENFHLGVTVHGPGAEVLQANAAALAMLRLTADQLLGKTSFDPNWDVVREDGTPLPGPEHPVPQA
ncbi:MAG TPA: PAS domain-containing protein, partial [Gemmataceae bacterium]|nr:PAS domain-containing protein [Gemmataceae bacterium]